MSQSMKEAIQRVLDAEKLEDGEYLGTVSAARNTKSGIAMDVQLEEATVTIFINTVDTSRVGALFQAARALEVDPFELVDCEDANDLLADKEVKVRCRTTRDNAQFFDLRVKDDEDTPKKGKPGKKPLKKDEEPAEEEDKKPSKKPGKEAPGKKPGKLQKKKETFDEGDTVKIDGTEYTVVTDEGEDTLVVSDGTDNYEVKRADLD